MNSLGGIWGAGVAGVAAGAAGATTGGAGAARATTGGAGVARATTGGTGAASSFGSGSQNVTDLTFLRREAFLASDRWPWLIVYMDPFLAVTR